MAVFIDNEFEDPMTGVQYEDVDQELIDNEFKEPETDKPVIEKKKPTKAIRSITVKKI